MLVVLEFTEGGIYIKKNHLPLLPFSPPFPILSLPFGASGSHYFGSTLLFIPRKELWLSRLSFFQKFESHISLDLVAHAIISSVFQILISFLDIKHPPSNFWVINLAFIRIDLIISLWQNKLYVQFSYNRVQRFKCIEIGIL